MQPSELDEGRPRTFVQIRELPHKEMHVEGDVKDMMGEGGKLVARRYPPSASQSRVGILRQYYCDRRARTLQYTTTHLLIYDFSRRLQSFFDLSGGQFRAKKTINERVNHLASKTRTDSFLVCAA